jgi:hypothetical protein
MKILLATCAVLAAFPLHAVDYCDDEVPVITPGNLSGNTMTPPSDAILLFAGHGLSEWRGKDGGAAEWIVHNGILTVKKGSGDIETRQSFHDFQLHVEWRIPKGITGEGQHRGNSGVFLLGAYEIQILDSYRSRTYADGQAGAVYGQVPPLVNAMRPPGQWNTYDIIFTAPRYYDDGKVLRPAHVTVLHNGLLIQNDVEILGATGAWGRPGYYEPVSSGPIRLQDHPGHDLPVSFRNIWIRRLNAEARIASRSNALPIISSKTVGQLLEDPAAREVLMRCVPELVPNTGDLDYIRTKRLDELQGEADITLTPEKLQRIEAQLRQALGQPSSSR